MSSSVDNVNKSSPIYERRHVISDATASSYPRNQSTRQIVEFYTLRSVGLRWSSSTKILRSAVLSDDFHELVTAHENAKLAAPSASAGRMHKNHWEQSQSAIGVLSGLFTSICLVSLDTSATSEKRFSYLGIY